jgi:hypothetical protein
MNAIIESFHYIAALKITPWQGFPYTLDHMAVQ